MRIVRSIRHKSCADGTLMKEFVLSAPLTREFFSYLREFGEVTAMPGVGEGFYTFDKPDCFSIKGFAGDTTVEVRFRREAMDLTTDFLYSLFALYRDGDPDFQTLKRREAALMTRVHEHLYGR
ncbi:hypothetical protein E2N92_05525 [Methanofollis formosanus]|uniref:Uncharacterized protein n=1 Tax=Methanofollis formosanus TaxID=299308 RepID=A0A8G1A1G6_9EURY|nr:hypothetical protein [Methanofollis formosanus]QYZ78923.1 hypothetical protein E2N92_05525 [Methanofollis formosanus]